jgi:hypothetical protein
MGRTRRLLDNPGRLADQENQPHLERPDAAEILLDGRRGASAGSDYRAKAPLNRCPDLRRPR